MSTDERILLALGWTRCPGDDDGCEGWVHPELGHEWVLEALDTDSPAFEAELRAHIEGRGWRWVMAWTETEGGFWAAVGTSDAVSEVSALDALKAAFLSALEATK